MRQTLIVLLLCLFFNYAHSQQISFYLHISDKVGIVSHNEAGLPVFDIPEVNTIFSAYNVNHFAKAFPLSGYEYLRRIYKITADSIGLAQELLIRALNMTYLNSAVRI